MTFGKTLTLPSKESIVPMRIVLLASGERGESANDHTTTNQLTSVTGMSSNSVALKVLCSPRLRKLARGVRMSSGLMDLHAVEAKSRNQQLPNPKRSKVLRKLEMLASLNS